MASPMSPLSAPLSSKETPTSNETYFFSDPLPPRREENAHRDARLALNGRPEKLYQLLQTQSTVPYSGDGRTVSAIALKVSRHPRQTPTQLTVKVENICWTMVFGP